jgi:hypothetical protein
MTIYYTVYQTTNLVNGKIYIGVHKTKNPNDSYLGSNKILKSAIKKYGRKNFKKEILFMYQNEEEMWAKEKELVNEEFVQRNDTYNIGNGGVGWTGLGQHIVENKIGILSEDYLINKKPEVSRKTQQKLKIENKGLYGFSSEERSQYGKKGAMKCKELNIGIFALSDEERTQNGKKGSAKSKELGVGIFALTFEERSKTSKKTIANIDPEERKRMCSKGGKIGARVGMERKTGIHGLSVEQRRIIAKRGNDKQRELGVGFFDPKKASFLGKKGGILGGPKNKGFRWYNDGISTYKYTKKEQEFLSFEDFLKQNPQFKENRLEREYKPRPKQQGKKTLTNGTKNLMLLEAEAISFLESNPDYRYGRTNFVDKRKNKT